MRNIFLIAWREYVENAKTKGFWIGILALPAIIFLLVQAPRWLEERGTPTRHYILADQSGLFGPLIAEQMEREHQRNVLEALHRHARQHIRTGDSDPAWRNWLAEFSPEESEGLDRFMAAGGKDRLLARLEPFLPPDAPSFQAPRRRFQKVDLPEELRSERDLSRLREGLRDYVAGAKRLRVEGAPVDLFAAILIPEEIEQLIVRPGEARSRPGAADAGIEYWSANFADMALRLEIQQIVNREIRRREYQARGMDAEAVQTVQGTYAPIANFNPKKEEGEERVGGADIIRQWAPSAFVYLLWVAIFAIAQMLLNNTIEEKSNRIIEVLLSSVTPGELMMGKLTGIAAVGMTMIGAWIAAMTGILLWQSAGQATGQGELAVELMTVMQGSYLLPAFIVYFLLGYLLYAGIILSLGSICNTLKDAQNYMAVIVMIMLVPLLTMVFIPKDPNGTLATVLSWIPIYTPFVMMNRAAASPPLFDVIGTMVLLLITTVVVLWLSGKIFRMGVLRTGQPPRLIELYRWMRG